MGSEEGKKGIKQEENEPKTDKRRMKREEGGKRERERDGEKGREGGRFCFDLRCYTHAHPRCNVCAPTRPDLHGLAQHQRRPAAAPCAHLERHVHPRPARHVVHGNGHARVGAAAHIPMHLGVLPTVASADPVRHPATHRIVVRLHLALRLDLAPRWCSEGPGRSVRRRCQRRKVLHRPARHLHHDAACCCCCC